MIFEKLSNSTIKVSMEGYINKILEELKVEGTVINPSNPNLFNIDNKSEILNEENKKLYHSTIAKLLYVSKRTRIDIATTISYLCTRAKSE